MSFAPAPVVPGRVIQFDGMNIAYHAVPSALPSVPELTQTMNLVLTNLETVQPGSVTLAEPGSGLPNSVHFVRNHFVTDLTLQVVDGVGIVARTPLTYQARSLRAVKLAPAIEKLVEEPFTDHVLMIAADEWDWGDESPLEGYEFSQAVADSVLFELKVISEGLGQERKFLTYTCASAGGLVVFLDFFLGTHIPGF